MSLSKYLIAASAVTAIGAGVLWLSRESETVKFDAKVHTLAKLLDTLDDIYLEYACAYIFFYNTILNMKEQGKFNEQTQDAIVARAKEYTKVRDDTVCKRLGITPAFLEQWIRQYQNEPKVLEVFKNIEDLQDQALIKHQIKEMNYELHEKLTREAYVQISRKVLACIRHEAYNQIQEILKKEGRTSVTNDELDEILGTIGDKYQESYRIGALKLFNVEVPEGQIAKRYLQKAYLKYSSISSLKTEPGQPVVRSKYNDQIQHEQKVHGE